MSIESAKAFLEKMKTDENFRKECSGKPSHEEWIKFVKESGYDFSNEDIEQVKSDLSDDELEMIVGGIGGRFGIYIKISSDDRNQIPE
ncbi:MAG: Nif11-like leader peptide family natural product precursor [bacterium]|nr:Nif11-like leader peptide family natural product precursor [bacterium]